MEFKVKRFCFFFLEIYLGGYYGYFFKRKREVEGVGRKNVSNESIF